MMHGWGFAGRMGVPQRFEEQYHCYSVAYADKAHLEGGDKILLPPSAFDQLARLQVDYPMLFRLQSSSKGTMTHCGVLEFTAEEGSCYVPFWMMQNLLIEEGSILTVTNVSLPKATFVKLQPQHVDFLEISNPRAVLEHALRNFSCVTKGDVICVPYDAKNYHFELKEVQPQDAACIIETDCNVDFDAPIGYKEPTTNGGGNAPGSSDTASVSSLANLPRQSPYADARSSGCPSPTPSSMSGASAGMPLKGDPDATDEKQPAGLRIVDGEIVQPENPAAAAAPTPDSSLVASRSGGTGVQRNAAIPMRAPEADYWAVSGQGARLDGKTPAALRDAQGNEIDVRKARADAAAKRAAAMAKSSSSFSTSQEDDKDAPKAPVRKNKSRFKKGQYSQLKKTGACAFGGTGNKIS